MWIKVCGIRDTETAHQIQGLDIDAIGLNFYERSPRVVDVVTAMEISKILPARIARVGLFVNHSIDDVESIATQCQLDHLQLHGDEPASFLIELKERIPNVRLIRAWRMGQEGLGPLKEYLIELKKSNCDLAACLVDAHVEGVFGGSGKQVPWNQLSVEYQRDEWPPLVLAGGLKPSNVADAISHVRPWGVDVASGVESAPGLKDISLVKEFISQVRNAGNT